MMSSVAIYLGAAQDVIDSLPPFDAVITDPPYGIDGGRGDINKARGKASYKASFDDTPDYLAEVVVPVIQKLRGLATCVILTPGNRNFGLYPQPDSFGCFFQPAASGMQVFGNLDAQPIYYYGLNATRRNLGKPCSYELIEMPEKNGHPCPKPLRAWTKLIVNNTLPGMTVLDPFMGSGTTGVACVRTGRNFLGIELDPNYFAIAERRIQEALAQPHLLAADEIESLTQVSFGV